MIELELTIPLRLLAYYLLAVGTVALVLVYVQHRRRRK